MSDFKPIVQLPSKTVQLITATQIATSVSNIVKELVENSLDAGSSVIRVKLENSGFDKIEVIDNGAGVSRENVTVMALPHYTSKIRDHGDLECLTSYGFRGEALAAICSVAKLTVTTKTVADDVAMTNVMDSNGNVIERRPSHLNQGTWIVITQLFHNVPVRKQFYQAPKKRKDELTKVEELLLAYGLIHPNLHLSLHHNQCQIWQKTKALDIKANISQTLGHAISTQMEFISEDEQMKMFMMVPKKTAPVDVCFRHRNDRCFTFINDRPVVSKEIEKIMKEIYANIHPNSGKGMLFPIYIMSFHFPGPEVDVNLEPNKSRVFIKRQEEVLDYIKETVAQVLGGSENQSKGSVVSDADSLDLFTAGDLANREIRSEQTETANSAQLQIEFEGQTVDILDTEELFNGFDEGFSPKEVFGPSESFSATDYSPLSADWSRGIVTDSNGRIGHPVEILRGQPHFAKRISEEPAQHHGQAKKAKIVQFHESLKIVGDSPRNLEAINGRVTALPRDAFQEYCKETKAEILSRNANTTFGELSQQLSQGWKNLTKDERQHYEIRATNHRQRRPEKARQETAVKTGHSLDRFLCPMTPVFQAPDAGLGSPSISVDWSIEQLMRRRPTGIGANCNWSFIGRLEQRNSWLCLRSNEIFAVNFLRLNEVVLYSRLISDHRMPSRLLNEPIIIDAKALASCALWSSLIKLPKKKESCWNVICDERIVSNGLAIRFPDDRSVPTRAQIYKVPNDVAAFQLDDLIELLTYLSLPASTITSCRPKCIKHFLRAEATRLSAERCSDPGADELCHLLEQWSLAKNTDKCLHGEPIMKSVYNIKAEVVY